MRVLVTGGSGLVGHALRDIRPDWYYPSHSEMDLMNYEQTLAYMKEVKPTLVIHLACKVGGLYMNMNNKESMYADNMRMNINIIEACNLVGVEKFVGILSTCIFPDKVPSYPITEDMIHLGPPHESNEGYAYAKRMMEVHLRLTKMKTLCLIPTNLFGPHDNFDPINGHVIPSLINKAVDAKITGTPLTVWGSGDSLRQFLYSKDFANIIVDHVDGLWDFTHFNFICAPKSTEEVSIKTIVEIISSHVGVDVIYDTNKSEGQYRKVVNGTFLNSNLVENIKDTIDWYITTHKPQLS